MSDSYSFQIFPGYLTSRNLKIQAIQLYIYIFNGYKFGKQYYKSGFYISKKHTWNLILRHNFVFLAKVQLWYLRYETLSEPFMDYYHSSFLTQD